MNLVCGYSEYKYQYVASIGTVADNNIKKQRKFCLLPKRYNKISSKGPSSGIRSDEAPLLETSNLIVSFIGSEQNFCCFLMNVNMGVIDKVVSSYH